MVTAPVKALDAAAAVAPPPAVRGDWATGWYSADTFERSGTKWLFRPRCSDKPLK
jgi:hypothetical protein